MDITTATETARCLRCGRKLTAAGSVASGYGPRCRSLIRQAVAVIDLEDVSEALHAKARELIADGGLIPSTRQGVFFAVSSDGTTTYIVDLAAASCTCKAGELGRLCYHSVAARLVTAASVKRAA